MKILFLIHTLAGGGAEKVLVNLIENMDKNEFDISVMTIVDYGVYVDKIKEMPGVKYNYIFKSFFKETLKDSNNKHYKIAKKVMDCIWKFYDIVIKYFFNEKKYRKYIKEEYDIEVAFLEGKSAKIISKSPNTKSKKFVWIHTDLTKLTKSSKIFINSNEEKKCYKTFDKVGCVSQGVKRAFIKKTGFSENVERHINPINAEEIIKESKETVTDIQKPDKLLLCTVGRLIPEKGYDRLLKCHKRLLDEGIEHELWILGEGVERNNLEAYIRENKLENSVKLLGYKTNPYPYMAKADLFVSSSRVEGFSTVLCEAIILGKPIVATRCPGTVEIAGRKGTGTIITKNDEEGLYEGLKKMITDKEFYNDCLEKVKVRAQRFELDKQIKNIESLLKGIENE